MAASFPMCPPYNSAYLASAPNNGAFIIPPYYPQYNSYDNSTYTHSGSSRAPSSNLSSPAAGTPRRPKPPPKTFEITIPKTSRKITVMFIERVTHVTASVEYGILPVDPDERAELRACYDMEVLNSTPANKVAFRTFSVDDKWMKDGQESILAQLLALGIVEPVKRVHYETYGKAFMLKVLLTEEEVRSLIFPRTVPRANSISQIAHACQNPDHKGAVFESPEKTRFGVRTFRTSHLASRSPRLTFLSHS